MTIFRRAGMAISALILACVAGCANMNESDMAALGLYGWANSADNARTANARRLAGDFAATSGNRSHDLNVAEAGRSNVNVNVVQERRLPPLELEEGRMYTIQKGDGTLSDIARRAYGKGHVGFTNKIQRANPNVIPENWVEEGIPAGTRIYIPE